MTDRSLPIRMIFLVCMGGPLYAEETSVRADIAADVTADVVVMAQDPMHPKHENESVCVPRTNQKVRCGTVVKATETQIFVNFDIAGEGIRVLPDDIQKGGPPSILAPGKKHPITTPTLVKKTKNYQQQTPAKLPDKPISPLPTPPAPPVPPPDIRSSPEITPQPEEVPKPREREVPKQQTEEVDKPRLIPDPNVNPSRKSRLTLVPAVGYSLILFDRSGIGNFTEHVLFLKLWMRYQFLPSPWVVTFNSNLHGVVLGSNSNNTARFLELEGKSGFSYVIPDSPWKVSPFLGVHYITMWSSPAGLAFKDLIGPQITIEVGRKITSIDSLAFAAKASLIAPPFIFSNYKFGLTAGWSRRLSPAHELWTTFEFLKINATFGNGTTRSLLFNLSFGYSF